MRKIRLFSLIMSFSLLVLCSSDSMSKDTFVFSLTAGNQTYDFVPQPQLGYVVKSSSYKSAMMLLESSLQSSQGDEQEYLNVANRPEIMVVLVEQPSAQSQNDIRILSNESDTEYIAPVYTLDGQTVAIIPEIIVRLVLESDFDKLVDLCLELNCTIIRKLLYTEQEFLISPEARNSEEVLIISEVLSSADFVEWAFPNLAFQPKLCGEPVINEPNRVEPNDVYFNDQWHLENIHAPEAWAYTTGDPNIVIAVLDTGVDINHPDLRDNIWINPNEIPDNGIDDDENGFIDDVHGWNFLHNDPNVIPSGKNAHGTACAGLIAAKGNNNLGVTGVAWNCKIMPLRIMSSVSSVTYEEIATAIRYAGKSGADILSNSWTNTATLIYFALRDITIKDGIGRNGKGCVVFFASGNWGGGIGPVEFPAAYPEVVAVGAINQNDQVWNYSGRGPELDIVAPSGKAGLDDVNDLPLGNLWTTDISGNLGYNNRDPNILDYTDRMGGTSGACPIAAGVAALILSIDPNLTNYNAISILLKSARDLGSSGLDEIYGFGCVDAYAAVTMALNPPEFILYVDDDAPDDIGLGNPNISDPNENGSLEHPFDSIQEAINYSVHGYTIIVLPGVYTDVGNRNIDFHGRDITVCSLNGPENCIIDCQKQGGGFYFHSYEGQNSIVDGITITNGYTDSVGGGIRIDDSSPTITNCSFIGNSANERGGGIYNCKGGPQITNCILIDNSANRGGGIYNDPKGKRVTLTNCIFIGNAANKYCGGGIENFRSSNTIIKDCVFTGNSANTNGGGTYNFWSSTNPIRITNCTFIINSANEDGGGIYYSESKLIITNCTFADNSALNGNALACNSYEQDNPSDVEIINSILWDGGNEIWNYGNSTIEITYSNIKDGFSGEGNIDADPCFADPGYWADANDPNIVSESDDPNAIWIDGDYHLKSEAGRWDPNSRSWIMDDVTSPCIDAGDPNSDWTAELWPHSKHINMGAFGGTPEASMSLSTVGNVADFNNDDVVNGQDLLMLADMWLSEDVLLAEDINRDSVMNLPDFAVLADNWFWQQ